VFTDSMRVLHWLQSQKPFLEGRIFKYVLSADNPADLALMPDHLSVPSKGQVTRNEVIAARNKLTMWLDIDDDVLLGSVTDHEKN